ncbi:MAG: hypothetical protein RLY30_867 [Pseudomonadota bacterium]|jgi:cobalt-zinc-cadmium efflux system protein
MSASHHHGPGDSRLGHQRLQAPGTWSLGFAVLLTLGFAVVELVAGAWSGSLALISDAGHMATDASGLLIALVAQFVARRPASGRFSYGYGRIEAIAAFVNGLLLLVMTGWILAEAIQRFDHPPAIHVDILIAVAVSGLMVNLLVAWALSRDKSDLNTRAALAHVMGDLLGSLAAIVAGVAIWLGAPLWIDPLLSILISLLIVRSAWAVLGDATGVLMEAAPQSVHLAEVQNSLERLPGVIGVHNLHIWSLAPSQLALSAHLHLRDMNAWPSAHEQALASLASFGIDHATLQPEAPPSPGQGAFE